MTKTDPLSGLRDIHLPVEPGLPVSFFIVALVALAAVVLTGLAVAALRRRKRGTKAEALRLLQAALELPAKESLLEQAKLLRRLARTVSGRSALALHGRDWLDHLDGIFATDFFTAGKGRVFGDALYRPDAGEDARLLAAELGRLIGRFKC